MRKALATQADGQGEHQYSWKVRAGPTPFRLVQVGKRKRGKKERFQRWWERFHADGNETPFNVWESAWSLLLQLQPDIIVVDSNFFVFALLRNAKLILNDFMSKFLFSLFKNKRL